MIKNGMARWLRADAGRDARARRRLSRARPTSACVCRSASCESRRRPPISRSTAARACTGTPINAEDDLRPGQVRLRAQVSGHGAGRRAAPAALRLFHPGSNRQHHAHRAPIVFRDVVLQTGDPVQTNLSLRTLGITYEYSFHASREIRSRRDHRHQRHRHLGARARVRRKTGTSIRREDQAGPVPDPRPRRHLGGEQAILFRRPRAILQDCTSITSTDRWASMKLARSVPAAPQHVLRVGLHVDQGRSRLARRPSNAGFFNFSPKGPEFFVRVAF